MNTTKTALKRMGYRQMKEGVWGKPVAYHLFVVELKAGGATFKNYFLGKDRKLFVYDSHSITDEGSIKLAEYSTRTNVGSLGFDSDFGFVSQEELFSDLM